jgi:hypothetical protein
MAAGPLLTFAIDATRRDIDVAEDIRQYEPNASPFTVTLMNARKKAIGSTETHWYDQNPQGVWTKINNLAGYLAGDTALVVDDDTIFAPGDLMKIPRTGETMLITAINRGTHTLTVTRSVGTVAAAAINDDDDLHRTGTAMEEASSAPESRLFQPTKFDNYTQIIRTTWDGSRTEEDEDLKTNMSERTRQRREKALEHKRDIERVLLFGEKSEDSTGKRRTCGGLTEFITTNVVDVGGVLTEEELEKDICEPLFKYGSEKRLVICSRRVFSVFNQFAKGRLEVKQGADTYGVRLAHYISAHGDLYLVPSRELASQYASWAFFLDMKNLRYRPYKNADTKLRTNIHDNDFDGYKDEYLTEFTFEVRQEQTHLIMKNCTG